MTRLTPKDGLLLVDVQNDFLPGGSLAVPGGDLIVPVLNRYIERFARKGLPIFATRDWHPAEHCSFKQQGGCWPPHCVASSHGAAFPPDLRLPDSTVIISKATLKAPDSYSGFEGTNLTELLRTRGIRRIFIGGLATDYCVLNTVTDGLALDFEVWLMIDAVRAVNVHHDDGKAAVIEMLRRGAHPVTLADIES